MELKDIKVELINPEEVKKFVEMHGRMACICYDTDEKFSSKVGESVLQSGHYSGSRGDTFKFKITGVPRACVDQIARHNVGAYPQVQSQRYVKVEDMNIFMPPIVANDSELRTLVNYHADYTEKIYTLMLERLEVLGIKGEKANEIARGVLPINIESAMTVALSLEGLINFMHKRLCTCAQDHVREVARLMRAEILDVAPIYEPYLVPICEHNLWCPESAKRCCGRYPTKDSLKNILNAK